jgi:hypothetical protein
MSDEEDFEYEIGEEDVDQYLDEDGSPLNIDIPDLSLEEDEGNFNVVPDRVKSLERYIDFLSESISTGSISQNEFDNEILKSTYYLDILTKKYNIVTEAKQKIIEDARILRKEAIEAYKVGAISEEKFNEVYTNAIRTEYSILKSSEIDKADDLEGSGVNLTEDIGISEKLEKLEKLEETQIRSIAKKHAIKFPDIPRGKTAFDINLYYTNKITKKPQNIDPDIEMYIKQYSEAKKMVDYHTTSFEVSKIFYNKTIGKPDFEFRLVRSIRGDIEQIKREDNRNQLLDPQEKAYVDRLNELKSMLRQMDRIDLIKCADTQLYELLTFIEKLRANKQYAFKFKQEPNELDIEQKILSDNELYKLPAENLLMGYNYTRPNIYIIEDTPDSIDLNEVGNLGYLALKEGRNPLNTAFLSKTEEDIDKNDYVTIVPFQDELYSKLQTLDAQYTEIIEVWEIRLDFIDGSNKILRYTSFEDFLLVFKRLLINKCKILKKIDDDKVLELVTKQSKIKYPRLKPSKTPFLLSQRTGPKSFEELRYEYYNQNATSEKIEMQPNPVAIKASSPITELDSGIKTLLNKIMQIEYYLIFKADKQQTLPTSQISPKELLEDESDVYKTRELGLEKLIDYISLSEPGAEEAIKKIESDIFSFSSKNYTSNIKKIIFIFDNFPEKMEDIILSKRSGTSLSQSSISELLVYETPNNLEDEKLSVKTDLDKRNKISELLEWKPETVLYDTHEDELTSSNHDFKKFIQAHAELRNIEINQIMSEYGEKIQWKKSIENYNKLEVPSGMIELNFRLRFLLRNRNRLPSRRIFKLATISNRVDRQEDLERTFGTCKLKNYKKMSLHVERIIYSLSKTPEDYMYYNYILNSKFKLICESLITLQESDVIDEYDMISILIKFIINNGDFSTRDIEKLVDFTKEITPENISLYIETLKEDELRAHTAYRLSKIDNGEQPREDQQLYADASKIAESERQSLIEENLIYLTNNTYVPPVVYNELPDNIEKYFLINGQYICGGFYPPFYRWDENVVAHENYTRDELVTLSDTFALNVSAEDTNYMIYERIKNFIDSKQSTSKEEINLVRYRFRFTPDIQSPYQYLNIPIKTIMYTVRSRYLVPLPGEVYNVILDNTNVYGVPFKFENGIPVYSSKLKELVENKFIIIEGPSLYEETSDVNFLQSNYYISIEYTDQRGLKIIFKEGVSEKKIIKKPSGYSACERFTNKNACDDPNSYSLELKGKRYKCIWRQNICKILNDTEFFQDFENFNITKVTFLETYKQRDWKNAIEKSLKYIEERIISEKLSQESIELLKENQKLQLFGYYKKLSNFVLPKELGETTVAASPEIVHDKSLLSEFEDILKPDKPRAKNIPSVQKGYVKFTIYKHKKTESVTSVANVVLNERYSTYLDGTYINIVPISFIPDKNSYRCNLDDQRSIEVTRDQIYNVIGNILKVIPVYCIVKEEDFPFLSKRPGYYWIHREKLRNRRYDGNGEPEIVSTEVEVQRYDVPTNFIEPTSNLPDLPIITRDNIFDAMYKTAFNTLTNSVNQLIYTTVEQFNATIEAKKFAVMNRIDLKKIIKIGTIGIGDLQKIPDVDYTIKTITPQQIFEKITEAIENKDISVLSEYYLMGVKAEIDKDTLSEAKAMIDSYNKPTTETEQEVVKVPTESTNVVSYVIQRPGKRREIKE